MWFVSQASLVAACVQALRHFAGLAFSAEALSTPGYNVGPRLEAAANLYDFLAPTLWGFERGDRLIAAAWEKNAAPWGILRPPDEVFSRCTKEAFLREYQHLCSWIASFREAAWAGELFELVSITVQRCSEDGSALKGPDGRALTGQDGRPLASPQITHAPPKLSRPQ